MRFESVKAHAFGPFRNETLELASGMNVIHGPNEAGKSSWHAALYAGLCGVRRGKGASRKDDQEFAARHRPWNGGAWEVGAVVVLDAGRKVELRHDLAGKVASSARDAEFAGRDYSNQIINDGAPDGSVWLGINRHAFLGTACVRQADMVEIRPEMLQENMQRAAATAGADETAAGALALLDSYRRDVVGSKRAPTKPLRQSETRVGQARIAWSEARAAHKSCLQRRADVDRREQDARAAQRKADAVAAALAEEDAVRAERRLERAKELDSEFPEGAPRPSRERDEVAKQITTVLTTWKQRPALTEPDGRTVEEYDRLIAEADARLIAARAAVAEREAQEAARRLGRVNELSGRFPQDRPPRFSAADEELTLRAHEALKDWEDWSSHASPGELSGRSMEDIEQELAEFDKSAAPSPSPPRALPLVAASGLVTVAGISIAAFLPDLRMAGIALAVTGIAGAAGALLWPAVTRARQQARAAREQAVFNAGRNGIIQRLEARRREEIRYQVELERRSHALQNLADAARACGIGATEPSEQARALRDWQEGRREKLQKNDELGALWDELQQRLGESSLGEIATEAERLRQDAASLAASADVEMLADARRQNLARERLDELDRETQENRIAWERARTERRGADGRFQAACRQVEAAEGKLLAAAAAVQIHADDAETLADALGEWQARRDRSIAHAEARSRRWDELQQLLGENSREEVELDANRKRAHANDLAQQLEPGALARAKPEPLTHDLLESLRATARDAKEVWNVKRGQLAELETSLPSVADAEDDLAEAQREMERVRQLDKTLERTIEFLKAAQEKVHKNIALALKKTVTERLSQVTGGRYTDCWIDPANLRVEVAGAGGRRRNAALLSHGTAEQVYLLLRLALARHLTAGSGETCPLILDDAVGASDGERKRAVLDTLLVVSESTQVILFTHENDVRDWARERLAGAANRLVELDRSGIPA